MVNQTPTALRKETAFLNGHLYKLAAPVQRQYISQPPQQFRLGDVGEGTHPLASITSWSDQRGGIGVDIMEGVDDLNRCWFSSCSLRHKGHIVLQRLATQTSGSGLSVGGGVSVLVELRSKIYALSGTGIFEYSNANDAWTLRRVMTATVTDAITVPLNGSETLVVARSGGVDYSTDGATWSQLDTVDIKYLTYWNDLLFGLGADGAFYFTDNLANGWTQIATFRAKQGGATDLFTGPARDPSLQEIIYVAANDGLYVYDNEVERFYKTEMEVPYHPTNGQGCIAWRNSVYFPAGQAIYRYTPGQVNAVDLVGPDRDDGLPEVHQGVIKKLTTTHNDLIALVGPTSQTQTAGTRAFRGATAGPSAHRGAFSGAVSTAGSVQGLVLGWNTQGWEVKWLDSNSLGTMEAAVVSNAYSQYRLWWAAGPNVYWMAVPVGIVNPNRVSTTTYAASGTWETPWFTADVSNFEKAAISVHLDSTHPTSSDTIALSRALNYDENDSAFTTIVTKTESGDQEYFLPGDDDREGLPFRAFKLRATLTRGATNTNSPDIKRLGLVYRKRVEPLYGFVVQINLRESPQGRSWREQRDGLVALGATKTLVPFTYRDERDNQQVHWVQMTGLTFIDNAGSEDSNLAQVVLTEIH